MDCQAVRGKLVLLHRNELPSLDRTVVLEHFKSCAECAGEFTVANEFFQVLCSPTTFDAADPSMKERVGQKLLKEFDSRFGPSRDEGFSAFRRSIVQQLKLSLAASSGDEGTPLIGRLPLGERYYVVYFTKERNELHLDFMDAATKRPTNELDGGILRLGKSEATAKVAQGAAELSLSDLIDASDLTVRLPNGEEIRVT